MSCQCSGDSLVCMAGSVLFTVRASWVYRDGECIGELTPNQRRNQAGLFPNEVLSAAEYNEPVRPEAMTNYRGR